MKIYKLKKGSIFYYKLDIRDTNRIFKNMDITNTFGTSYLYFCILFVHRNFRKFHQPFFYYRCFRKFFFKSLIFISFYTYCPKSLNQKNAI